MVSSSSCPNVAVYLPGLRAHMEVCETVKAVVKEVGGSLRASLPFMHDDCTSAVFKPTEGKQRRCITIPHTAIPAAILVRLNERGV